MSVDRELPALLHRYQPDALLMFGLAAATPHLRIETWARNALSPLPDDAGVIAQCAGDRAGPHGSAIAMTTPARALRRRRAPGACADRHLQ